MDHHDDVGAQPEGLGIAGLLVAPVPEIDRVDERSEPERAGQRRGAIAAGIIDRTTTTFLPWIKLGPLLRSVHAGVRQS